MHRANWRQVDSDSLILKSTFHFFLFKNTLTAMRQTLSASQTVNQSQAASSFTTNLNKEDFSTGSHHLA